jgi:hypothetical protein
MALEYPESDIAQIMEEVKPVSDLDRIGCALSGTLGVLTTAVATDDCDTGMLQKPCREGLRAPIREEIDGAMALQIDEDTAIDATAPEGKIIHAQDARRRLLGKGEAADLFEQGVAADLHTEMMKESRSRFTAERKGDMDEPVTELAGAAGEGSDKGGETFTKRAPWAARIDTEEPADKELQDDGHAIDGQVTGMAPVMTMNASRPAAATRA